MNESALPAADRSSNTSAPCLDPADPCCTPALAGDCVPSLSATALSAEDEALAGLAKALAHPLRVHILRLLLECNGCICADVVNDLALPQSTVSQHLKVLKDAGLICATPSGRTICYAPHPQGLRRLRQLIAFL